MSTSRRLRAQPFVLLTILSVSASNTSPSLVSAQTASRWFVEAKEPARVAARSDAAQIAGVSRTFEIDVQPGVELEGRETVTAEGTPNPCCGPPIVEGFTATFCNPGPITINDNSTASPYPSNIVVSGETGVVSSVTVSLTGVSHSFPDDINILLVGPGGQKMLLMANAGGGDDISNANLTFSDAAAGYLPDATLISSGTFRPSTYNGIASFAAPAPPTSPSSPYAATLSTFKGTNPNGTWSLYVRDVLPPDAGSINGGWCLSITTAPLVACPATLFTGALSTGDPTQTGRIVRNGISSLCTALKAYPGTQDAAAGRRFDRFTIVNQNSTPQCVTASLSSGCATNGFLVAYANNYVPTNVQTNYLADNGASFAAQGGLMSFTMAPGATVVLVVHEITANSGCASYGLLVEGNICLATTAVEPAPGATPLALNAASPNPFAERTAIAFTLPSRSWVSLRITDIAGRHVATLTNETLDTGPHSVQWAGLDEHGHRVPRGVYLVDLRTEHGARATKMVLCR